MSFLILKIKRGYLHKLSSPDSIGNSNIKFILVNLFKINKKNEFF